MYVSMCFIKPYSYSYKVWVVMIDIHIYGLWLLVFNQIVIFHLLKPHKGIDSCMYWPDKASWCYLLVDSLQTSGLSGTQVKALYVVYGWSAIEILSEPIVQLDTSVYSTPSLLPYNVQHNILTSTKCIDTHIYKSHAHNLSLILYIQKKLPCKNVGNQLIWSCLLSLLNK